MGEEEHPLPLMLIDTILYAPCPQVIRMVAAWLAWSLMTASEVS